MRNVICGHISGTHGVCKGNLHSRCPGTNAPHATDLKPWAVPESWVFSGESIRRCLAGLGAAPRAPNPTPPSSSPSEPPPGLALRARNLLDPSISRATHCRLCVVLRIFRGDRVDTAAPVWRSVGGGYRAPTHGRTALSPLQKASTRLSTSLVQGERNALCGKHFPAHAELVEACARASSMLVVRFNDTAPHGISDEFALRTQAELAQDVGAVRLHRARADEQSGGHLGAAAALGDEV